MFKTLVFACILAVASAGNLLPLAASAYTGSPYYSTYNSAVPLAYSAPAGFAYSAPAAPLAYASSHYSAPLAYAAAPAALPYAATYSQPIAYKSYY